MGNALADEERSCPGVRGVRLAKLLEERLIGRPQLPRHAGTLLQEVERSVQEVNRCPAIPGRCMQRVELVAAGTTGPKEVTDSLPVTVPHSPIDQKVVARGKHA